MAAGLLKVSGECSDGDAELVIRKIGKVLSAAPHSVA
jgi:hypothetical protein